MTTASPIELVVGDDEDEDATPPSHFMYQTVFTDHGHGEGVVLNPTILRMRVERNETSCSKLRFESRLKAPRPIVMGGWRFGFSKGVEYRKASRHQKGCRCFKFFVCEQDLC